MGYKRVKFTPYAARSVQEGVLCPPGPVRSLSQAAKLHTGEIGRFVPLSPQKDPKGTEQPPIPRFKQGSFIRSHHAMPLPLRPFPHRSLRRLTQAARACSAGVSLAAEQIVATSEGKRHLSVPPTSERTKTKGRCASKPIIPC